MSASSLLTHPGRPYTAPRAFLWGGAIGALGGLIGLGGAEFRLPVLVARFGFKSLDAVVMNKAISLVVVSSALLSRFHVVPVEQTLAHADIVLNLLAGTVIGSWFAAGYAVRLAGPKLDRLVFVLLTMLAIVMLAEGLLDIHGSGQPLFAHPVLRFGASVAAGLVIGSVAALLGVAGGELLIPTIVLLYGVDIRLAGSLSLAVSLPTMMVGLNRYRMVGAFANLPREKCLLFWMSLGSIGGAAIGGLLLGIVPARALTLLLGVVLAISAAKVFSARATTGHSEAPKEIKPQDTPRGAFDLLPRRTNVAVVAALVSVSLVAWGGTVEQADSMGDMVMGRGQVGHRNLCSVGAIAFLATWSTMMAAMMLPTIAPMVLAHHAVAHRRVEGTLSTLAFVIGYLLVWSAIGVVVWLAYRVVAHLEQDAAQPHWPLMLAGAVLAFAGFYQFTRLKRRCADMCRSPLTFVFNHDSHRGVGNALRAGVVHGAYCLGCCWAAMTVLVVVGLMNLVWMTILFALFFVEKNWTHGRAVAKAAGVSLIALGIAILAYPPLLAGISS